MITVLRPILDRIARGFGRRLKRRSSISPFRGCSPPRRRDAGMISFGRSIRPGTGASPDDIDIALVIENDHRFYKRAVGARLDLRLVRTEGRTVPGHAGT